jgi:hypothetical protein
MFGTFSFNHWTWGIPKVRLVFPKEESEANGSKAQPSPLHSSSVWKNKQAEIMTAPFCVFFCFLR